jgi:hypothetical protein
MKLCFVSVNGPRETYFVDEPRRRDAKGKHEKQGRYGYEWDKGMKKAEYVNSS